jgi:uncharacterized protein (DUF302 family)
MAPNGLITVESRLGVTETIDRLAETVVHAGLRVFARIDHAAGAREVGASLRPTELLIFGNAKGGTPLMQASQGVGIDLPLKALVWEDANGKTSVSYNSPLWIAVRHGLDVAAEGIAAGLTAAIAGVVGKATGQQA